MLQNWFVGLLHKFLEDPASAAKLAAFLTNLQSFFNSLPQAGATEQMGSAPLNPFGQRTPGHSPAVTRWLSFAARYGLTVAIAAGSTWYATKPAPTSPAAVVAVPVAKAVDARRCTVCGSQAGTRLSGNPLACSLCVDEAAGFNLIEAKAWMPKEDFVVAVLNSRVGNMELDAIIDSRH